MATKISVFKNTSKNITCTVKTDGTATDITGQTILFTIKTKKGGSSDDSDALVSKTITSLSDPTNGVFILPLTTTDTNLQLGTYQADFKRINSGTVLGYDSFELEIVQTVTQRNS